jgi:hypothetical protein
MGKTNIRFTEIKKKIFAMSEVKIKKRLIVSKSFEESPSYLYWITKTPLERLAAMELLRSWMYENNTQRIQRILTVTYQRES